MGWIGGTMSFVFLWAFCLLVVLPRGQATQHEQGEIVPGTPPGAPAQFSLGRRLIYTTLITFVVWAAVFATVSMGWLSLEDFDFITPESIRAGGR